MSCGRRAAIRCSCAARSATSTWWNCAAAWGSSPQRIPFRSGMARADRSRSRPCSCSTTTLSGPRAPRARRPGSRGPIKAGVVCTDEMLLHPDPYPSREAWCEARLTRYRSAGSPTVISSLPTVLVNHFPLVREPTRILRYPEFAQWCGTERTADWHIRYGATAVVYGHLHIPRTTWHDGVRFEEVSCGYPREWRPRQGEPGNPAPDTARGAGRGQRDGQPTWPG